ncbi:diphosphomevalonate decarboxylase [Acrasis kona]|uniref:Diphosphomevalonate decarboxylase n=1 Tax=Acrasis kona TaxID=1008807 RepID=A0AAW2Z109_9EUKA
MHTNIVTCTAPVNIAVIKYWGKKDEKLHIPLNSSLSASLDQKDLKTTTSVVAGTDFTEDELWLNGKKENVESKRIQNVLRLIREGSTVEWKDDPNYKLRIVSTNNFPTAAGLASSASGYCCLVYALAQLYGCRSDLSAIARLGSGSACRSMYGGWVAWEMGRDHESSVAVQVADEKHWPEVQILVCVVSDVQKHTSSSDGMQQSVRTSKLLADRAENIVPKRMEEMKQAILTRDFHTFADLTMKDSDSFHACCADTQPPIYYMNNVSHHIVSLVQSYNKKVGSNKVAYTYDAGPNAVLYIADEKHMVEMLKLLHIYFNPSEGVQRERPFFDNEYLLAKMSTLDEQSLVDGLQVEKRPDALKYILHTKPGPGPQISQDHLISL